jgi:isoquinoline 1-oxidoreductase
MSDEKYLDEEFRAYLGNGELSRREFMRLAGGGIFVFFLAGEEEAEGQQRRGGMGRDYPTDFNAYLRIAEDGRVTGYSGKVELGQGVKTSLGQILAEELDVPFASVDMVLGDTAVCPWDGGTFGSRTIKYFGPALRAAAAEARLVLIQLAAEALQLPESRLKTRDGLVLDSQNPATSISYGALAKGRTIEKHLTEKPAGKPVASYAVSGQPLSRVDARAKATGEAKYTADLRPEGLLYAKVLRPPAHGSKLVSVDTSEAEKMDGVRVVKDGDLIAALHATPDGAAAALAKVKAVYEEPDVKLDQETIFDHLVANAPQGQVVEEKGDLESGRKLAVRNFESTYLQGYVAHAPMEPHAALASVEREDVTVWASTQRPFGVPDDAARALGIPAEKVHAIAPYVGGGFGGKNRNLQVGEAARLSRLTGKPVQVALSRQEEFFLDTFQPAAVIKIRSGVDAAGAIVFWDYEVFFAGERSSQVYYDVPHFRVVFRGGWSGSGGASPQVFDVGAWRGPGSNTNIFARESHIDVMAAGAKMDPLEFRLKNLRTNDRMVRVLRAVADKFGWRPAPAPSGRGVGVACLDYLGTYVAHMAEVEVNKATGEIQVKRIVSAQDMGGVINPLGARMQIEGGVTMGLGYALKEEIHFRGRKIADLNYDTYLVPRFSWLPKIETILIDNPGLAPQGGGEPAITGTGAVLANAVFDATGARFNRLPMSPGRVKAALAALGSAAR